MLIFWVGCMGCMGCNISSNEIFELSRTLNVIFHIAEDARSAQKILGILKGKLMFLVKREGTLIWYFKANREFSIFACLCFYFTILQNKWVLSPEGGGHHTDASPIRCTHGTDTTARGWVPGARLVPRRAPMDSYGYYMNPYGSLWDTSRRHLQDLSL